MGDKPPSRKRYEKENPTVSFRISREKKEQFDEMVEGMETTKKDWFETVIEDGKHQYDAVWKQGHTEGRKEGRETGYDEGYQDAKEQYRVTVPCSQCGEPMELTNENAKESMYKLLDKLSLRWTAQLPDHFPKWGWRHTACSED